MAIRKFFGSVTIVLVLILCIFQVLLFVPRDARALDSVVISNGSFEGGVSGSWITANPIDYHDIPASWTVEAYVLYATSGYTYPYSNIEWYSSEGGHRNVLCVDTPWVSSSSYSTIILGSSVVNLPSGGTDYQLQFSYLKPNNGGSSNYVLVSVYGEGTGHSTSYGQTSLTTIGDGQWHQVTVPVSNSAAGHSVHVEIYVKGNGANLAYLYLDDFVFYYAVSDNMYLTPGSVDPTSGTTGVTTFTYSVGYTDSANHAPSTKNVYIDGVAHQMSSSVTNYWQGVAFRYSTTILTHGSHNFYFEFSCPGGKTYRLPTTGTYSGPTTSPPTADLYYSVKNWDGGYFSDQKGYVRRHDAGHNFIDQRTLDTTSRATWLGIQTGTYIMEAWRDAGAGSEYWGDMTIAVVSGSNSFTFTRNLPISTSQWVGDTNGNVRTSFDVGEILRTKIVVKNIYTGSSLNSHVRCAWDRDGTPVYDFDQTSNAASIGPNGLYEFLFDYQIPAGLGGSTLTLGFWVFTSLLGGSTVLTDSWVWTATHVTVNSPAVVSITWRYYDEDDHAFATCRGAYAELWKPNWYGYHDVVDWGFTSEDGFISFEPSGPGEYTVAIWTDDRSVVKVAEKTGAPAYYWYTDLGYVTGAKSWTIWIDDDRNLAWQFYSDIRYAREWLFSEVAWSRSPVQVIWPMPWPESTAYNWIWDYIGVQGDSMPNDWVLYHEYSHAIHQAAWGDWLPPAWGSPHEMSSETSPEFALLEGWAEFLASAIDDYQGLEHSFYANVIDSNDWDGNIVEGAVAEILWDLYDEVDAEDHPNWSPSGYGDFIDSQFVNLWGVFKDRKPKSIDELWNYWSPKNADLWAVFYNSRVDKDTAPPMNPTSFTGPPTGVWSKDITIDVWVEGASDDLSGIWCYDFLWSDSPQDPIGMNRAYSNHIPTYHPASGYWYLSVRAIDRTGKYASGYYWNQEPWMFDVTPPANPSSYTSSHQINVSSSDRNIWIQWFGASDAFSGLAGYSVLWDNSPASMPDNALDTAETTSMSGSLADGTWYFHVRARDVAGNWALGAYDVGPFIIGLPPDLPPVAVITGDSSGFVNEALHFDAYGSYDPDGTIVAYSWQFDDGSTGMGPVVEHSWSNAGTYTVALTVMDNQGFFDQEFVSVTIIPAPPPDPGALSSIRISGGTDSFNTISGLNKQLIAVPGEVLTGEVQMEVTSAWAPSAVVFMIGTSSWGTHSLSYWDVSYIAPGVGTYTSYVNIEVPSAPGTYHVIFACRGEFNGAQVASATNWYYGNPVWDDGNDVADFSAGQITEAQSSGRTIGSWLLWEGYTLLPIPADAITIVVPDLSPRLDIHVSTDKVVYTTGEPVNISISLINNGLGTAVLTFPSTMQAYYTVADSLGYPVYDYRLHAVGMPVMTDLVLLPGQTVYYNYTWEQVNDGGTQVPSPQWYTIKGFVSATEVNLQSATSIVIAPASEQFTLVLKAGWNFVSVPLVNDSIKASTLGLQTGDIVAAWDSVAQEYGETYVIGVSAPAYDFSIEQGVSYMIWVSVETQIVVKGISPDVLSSYSMSLTVGATGGWTCIGVVSLGSTMHASDLASCVSGAKVLFVSKWNSTSSVYEDYVVGISPSSYDFEIEPGKGYWMWIDHSGVLEYAP